MTRPLRVVHVAPYYPPHLGGMETVARNVAERTAAAGVDVSVVTSSLPRRRSSGGDGVPVARCAAFELCHTPVIPALLPRLLREPRGSILHLHVAQPLLPELVWLTSRLRGTPYVAHFHLDVGPSGPLGFLLPAYKRAFLARALADAAAVVVCGTDDASLVRERFGVLAEVIPGGVDPPGPATLQREPATVLFVGRLSRQKGIGLLLDALGVLRDRGSPAALRIAGEGEEEGRIRRAIATKRLDDRVTLLGRLEGVALEREYRSATLLALPSERESFGLVLVEAMARGLPIVAADVPGIRGVVAHGECGLLAPRSAEPFAGALARVIDRRDVRESLARNGVRAARAYDWREVVPRWLDLYGRVRAAAAGGARAAGGGAR